LHHQQIDVEAVIGSLQIVRENRKAANESRVVNAGVVAERLYRKAHQGLLGFRTGICAQSAVRAQLVEQIQAHGRETDRRDIW